MSAPGWMSRRAASMLLMSLCVASLPAVAGPRGGETDGVVPPPDRAGQPAAPITVTTPGSSDVTTVGVDLTVPEAVVELVPNIERGKVLADRCATCHGATGAGLGTVVPKLAGLDLGYLKKQTEDLRSGARVPAAAAATVYQELTDQDILDVSAYFESSTRYREPRDALAAAKGKKLYLEGRVEDEVPPCVSCHGSRGDGYVGVIAGGFPGVGAQRAEYVVAQLLAYRAGTRTTDHNGMMQYATKNLDEGDIQSLGSYIQGLVPEGVVAVPKSTP